MNRKKFLKILLIEDNAEDARSIQNLFQEVADCSFDIVIVELLQDAVKEVAIKHFDVILANLELADSDGLCAINHLQNAAPHTPIIVLSRSQDDNLALQAVHNGAQDYLVKNQINSYWLSRSLYYAIERKMGQERLAFLAQHDHLTGLPNRTLFLDRLSGALKRCHRKGSLLALMFLDLDHFKQINDSFGHNHGDQLLEAIADRLKNSVREDDTVARLGGDEFTIILESIAKPDDVILIAEKILDIMKLPLQLGSHKVSISTSIGISLCFGELIEPQAMIRDADAAMYHAKEHGRNNYQFYIPEVFPKSLETKVIENSLEQALEKQEFVLYYHPQVSLSTGRVTSMEALLRWCHPKHGMVSPSNFLHIQESSILDIPIGEWVLTTACGQARSWQNIENSPAKVTVNLSANQLQDKNLVNHLIDILGKTGLDPSLLELDIRETILIDSSHIKEHNLRGLQDMGVSISIDDFGKGYTSIAHLQRLHINKLKIDKSFIQGASNNSDDYATVKAIITLAHSIGLGVLAEGVENEQQLTNILRQDCDEAQGFLFELPLPAEKLEPMFKAYNGPWGYESQGIANR